ncbi:MAG TPA: LexA family transcriptional regulator [Tepidisphaeraceae bacterium]|nr:LexA family transcriptional regulator [Tepidisphaeraceae bacterium]
MSQPVTIMGRRFAAIRRERYLTQEEFAQRLEMSPANVRRLEQSEVSGMQVKNFRRLATLLDLAPDELRQRIGAPAPLKSQTHTTAESDADAPAHANIRPKDERPDPPVHGPDFPTGIGAGKTPVVDVAHFHGVSAARVEQRTETHRGNAPAPAGPSRRFAVTVDGDCMEPRYRHGDVVLFSVEAAEREGIIDGKNYFLQFADGENTFKRVFPDPDNRELLILKCWNEKYAPRIIERSRIKLLARAVFRMLPDE